MYHTDLPGVDGHNPSWVVCRWNRLIGSHKSLWVPRVARIIIYSRMVKKLMRPRGSRISAVKPAFMRTVSRPPPGSRNTFRKLGWNHVRFRQNVHTLFGPFFVFQTLMSYAARNSKKSGPGCSTRKVLKSSTSPSLFVFNWLKPTSLRFGSILLWEKSYSSCESRPLR